MNAKSVQARSTQDRSFPPGLIISVLIQPVSERFLVELLPGLTLVVYHYSVLSSFGLY